MLPFGGAYLAATFMGFATLLELARQQSARLAPAAAAAAPSQPLIDPVVAAVCFMLFACGLVSEYVLSVPPQVTRPVMSRRWGRFVYLTHWSNCICTAYHALCAATMLGALPEAMRGTTRVDDGVGGYLVVALFPMCTGLGLFLTPAYYVLDHFNPESVARRAHFVEHGYPYLQFSAHLSHMFAAPAALLHACALNVAATKVVVPPLEADGASGLDLFWLSRPFIGFLAFYLTNLMLIKKDTGEWVYPVFDDIAQAKGTKGVVVFLGICASLIYVFGLVGCMVAASSSIN